MKERRGTPHAAGKIHEVKSQGQALTKGEDFFMCHSGPYAFPLPSYLLI